MRVEFHHAARAEFNAIPSENEKEAMREVIRKQEAQDGELGAPHARAIVGSRGLWELRPRAGRSRWRAMYRRVGHRMLVGAFGPEARIDRPGFDQAVRRAEARIAEYERRERRG